MFAKENIKKVLIYFQGKLQFTSSSGHLFFNACWSQNAADSACRGYEEACLSFTPFFPTFAAAFLCPRRVGGRIINQAREKESAYESRARYDRFRRERIALSGVAIIKGTRREGLTKVEFRSGGLELGWKEAAIKGFLPRFDTK